MALDPHISAASRILGMNAIFDVLNGGGFLRIYDGAKPASPETAIGAQVLLASLALSATAFGAAAGAGGATVTKTANAITSATIAATGTAAWGSLVLSNGTTRVQDFTVGTATTDMIVNTTAFVSGANCSCSSLVENMPA